MKMPEEIYAYQDYDGNERIWRDFDFNKMPNDFTLVGSTRYVIVPDHLKDSDVVVVKARAND